MGHSNDASCSGSALTYNWFKASGTYDSYYNPNIISVCGSLTLGGRSDWRLPAKKELITLVDYSIPYPGPTINPIFTNTKQSGYWSSTAGASYPGSAWGVYFNDGYVDSHAKGSGMNVRCVRGGQSGGFDNLDHFEFSAIPSSQVVGAPFSVTITAKDAYGNVKTGYSGLVTLGSSAGNGSVYPGAVQLIFGQWTGNLSVNSAGNIYLTAGTISSSGYSNLFDVTGQSSQYGNLSGEIRDRRGALVAGSVQIIVDGAHNYSMTVEGGRYQFPLNTIVCGSYTAYAKYGSIESPSYPIYVPCDGRMVTEKFELPFSPAACNPDHKTPVLLLAGVMGSYTNREGLAFPVLQPSPPAWDSKKLRLFNIPALDTVGWNKLKNKLTGDGQGYEPNCTLFEVPYDWRMDIRKIAGEYLKPWIEKAKDESGMTGVDIIAHSMGGLVTRAYLQDFARKKDGSAVKYAYDIRKFAMVGTPNEGSAKAYYMWEGGDPLLLDNIVSGGFGPGNFYWNTTEENYDEAHSGSLWSWEHKEIWDYYTGGEPKGDDSDGMIGLMQLLPTYDFLRHNRDDHQIEPLKEVKNSFLLDLNSSSKTNRMGYGEGRECGNAYGRRTCGQYCLFL